MSLAPEPTQSVSDSAGQGHQDSGGETAKSLKGGGLWISHEGEVPVSFTGKWGNDPHPKAYNSVSDTP